MDYYNNQIDIEIYIALVLLVNRIVAGLMTPLMDEIGLNKKWLMYVAWIFSAWIIFVTDLNLFTAIIPDPVVGKLLTSVAIGGGANVLHDLSDTNPAAQSKAAARVNRVSDAKDR